VVVITAITANTSSVRESFIGGRNRAEGQEVIPRCFVVVETVIGFRLAAGLVMGVQRYGREIVSNNTKEILRTHQRLVNWDGFMLATHQPTSRNRTLSHSPD
jgi:hypothetical protein